jgi:integrase
MRIKLYRGTWCAVWSEGGRTRRASLRTKDRGVAEQRLADLNAKPIGDNVAAIYQAYAEDLTHRSKSRERVDFAWKRLGDTFGSLRPDQVTRLLWRSYAKARRKHGASDGTIGKELSTLRAALLWRDRATAATVELPAQPPPRDRYLTRDEYRDLRFAAKRGGLHIYVFVVLGLATAGRKQALLDLTWDRVDFTAGRIRLATDGQGKGRATVPMTRHARRTLRIAYRARTCERVIEYAGKPVGSIKRAFSAAANRAGLEGVTPHVLRHTAAVWMAEAGVPMTQISQYLGHRDSRITERVYARFSPDFLSGAARALA